MNMRHRAALRGIVLALGILEALLLARLTALVLAANPANWAIGWLYALSAPLRWPLAALDSVQPRFGSRLEISTLAVAALLLVLALGGLWLLARGGEHGLQEKR